MRRYRRGLSNDRHTNREEYEALAAEAAKSGKEPAALLHDLIRDLQSARIERPMTGQELAEQLYHEGKLANLATREPITPEEQAERERLARLFAGGNRPHEWSSKIGAHTNGHLFS